MADFEIEWEGDGNAKYFLRENTQYALTEEVLLNEIWELIVLAQKYGVVFLNRFMKITDPKTVGSKDNYRGTKVEPNWLSAIQMCNEIEDTISPEAFELLCCLVIPLGVRLKEVEYMTDKQLDSGVQLRVLESAVADRRIQSSPKSYKH